MIICYECMTRDYLNGGKRDLESVQAGITTCEKCGKTRCCAEVSENLAKTETVEAKPPIKTGKTQATLDLEQAIWKATRKPMGTFCCFEVTIGYYGHERVDYITYDSKGIWRCYEIKSSKSDFHSKAALSFVGHYNYFVLTRDVYDQVKDDIPADIGVYVGRDLIKHPRRRALAIDEKILYASMIRSLYRYADDKLKCNTPSIVEQYKRDNERLKRENADMRRRGFEISMELSERRRAERLGVPFDADAFDRDVLGIKEETV